jgi:Zn-finger nucleic acid-binding protein
MGVGKDKAMNTLIMAPDNTPGNPVATIQDQTQNFLSAPTICEIENNKNESYEIDLLSKEFKKLFQKELNKATKRLKEELNNKELHIYNLEQEIKNAKDKINTLTKSLHWEKNNLEDCDDIDKHIKNIDKFLDDGILSLEPPQGWHTPDVGNARQNNELRCSLNDYTKIQNPWSIANDLLNLIRLVQRFEREAQTVDSHLMRYMKQLAAKAIYNRTPEMRYSGIDFYYCPHCRKHLDGFESHLEKVISQTKYVPPVKYNETGITKYPRIKCDNQPTTIKDNHKDVEPQSITITNEIVDWWKSIKNSNLGKYSMRREFSRKFKIKLTDSIFRKMVARIELNSAQHD